MRCVVMNDLLHQHMHAAAKRHLSGQHLKQDDSQRVDIGTTIRLMRLALCQLGRHVGGRTQDLTVDRHRDLAGLATRQPKVRQLWLTMVIDQNILGFEIAMHHAGLMGVVQGIGNLGAQRRRLGKRRTLCTQPIGQ